MPPSKKRRMRLLCTIRTAFGMVKIVSWWASLESECVDWCKTEFLYTASIYRSMVTWKLATTPWLQRRWEWKFWKASWWKAKNLSAWLRNLKTPILRRNLLPKRNAPLNMECRTLFCTAPRKFAGLRFAVEAVQAGLKRRYLAIATRSLRAKSRKSSRLPAKN